LPQIGVLKENMPQIHRLVIQKNFATDSQIGYSKYISHRFTD